MSVIDNDTRLVITKPTPIWGVQGKVHCNILCKRRLAGDERAIYYSCKS